MPRSALNLVLVAGARPNFVKIAPIWRAANSREGVQPYLVHTGQHYDAQMSDVFFHQLGLPQPDAHLGVGSGSHAVQTARVMTAFDVLLDERPADMVLTVGDVNSTLACALVAAKRGIAVAHVEAGLRSRDRSMPEELNRILTDQLSDMLFTTERSAAGNLAAEGIPAARVHFVGNVMIDSLLANQGAAEGTRIVERLGLERGTYAACTLHRPSNVDTEEAAHNTIRALEAVAGRLLTVWPLHPRTGARLQEFGLMDRVVRNRGLRVIEPLGYLEFSSLMANARAVFTDSGGIQEETTVLGVPCITFRENTERPITVTEGTNRLVGTDPDAVAAAIADLVEGRWPAGRIPELWDGHAAERILGVISQYVPDRRLP